MQQAENAARSEVNYYDLFSISAFNCVPILIRYFYFL